MSSAAEDEVDQAPQFGLQRPGHTYTDRPAAFGLALKDGALAVVKINKGSQGSWFDLPGGALEPGEDPELAVVREFGEETGLIVTPLAHLTRADQYFLNTNGETHNNRGHFFAVRIKGEDAALKVENDHTLTWLSPDRALRLLRHEAHAWAVAFYLRRGMATGAGRA